MIHSGKKWSTLTAAVLLALGSLTLPQTAWAATVVSGNNNLAPTEDGVATALGNGTAVGNNADAASYGTAVGAGAYANDYSVALGYGTNAKHSYSVALGYGAETTEDNSVSVGGHISETETITRTITNVTAGDSANDAAVWDQIAKTGQTVSFFTETSGEGAEATVTKHNQLVANDGTVLATFEAGAVAENNTGFVSGGTVYDYLTDALSTAYTGSDTISITDGKISVKNMAWNEGKRSLSIGIDNNIATAKGASGGKNNYVIGTSNDIGNSMYGSGGNNNYVIGASNTIRGGWNAFGGNNNYVIGSSNKIGTGVPNGESNYVFGSGNEITANNTIVLGSNITSVASNSVVIGNGSTSEAENTVSVGSDNLQRKIVHVASGSANSDAANFGQLIAATTYSATSSDASKAQTATLTSNDGSSSVSVSIAGEGSIASGDNRLVSGDTVYKYIQDTIAGGSSGSAAEVEEIQENITTEGGTYIEAGTDVGGNLEKLDGAIGEVKLPENQIEFHVIEESRNADGSLKTSMAENLMKIDEKIGSLDESRDPESNARAMKYNVISSRNTISENLEALDDAAFGATANLEEIAKKIQYEGATVTGESAIGLGQGSNASGSDSISLGTGAQASGASALALGKGANASKENALAFGTSAAASKENALAFGNGAKASEANTLAFGNGATASSENAMAFGNGASATGSGSVAIGSGSTASEDNVVSFGAAGSERRLTNVAAGVNDTDAVNVGQMNSAIGENFNYLKSSLTRDINKVAAGSAALAALRPEGFDPDDKFSMAVGFGHYKSANAGAIGAFYKPNYDTTFSIGATLGDGETIMNMGVSFKLGSRGKRLPQTGAALSQEVASLRENNEALKKDNASQATAIEEQAKEIADLKADNERMKADNERMKEQIAMILSKMELSEKVEKTMVKAG